MKVPRIEKEAFLKTDAKEMDEEGYLSVVLGGNHQYISADGKNSGYYD